MFCGQNPLREEGIVESNMHWILNLPAPFSYAVAELWEGTKTVKNHAGPGRYTSNYSINRYVCQKSDSCFCGFQSGSQTVADTKKSFK